MNKYLEINQLLDNVLGTEARAIWLSHRVDDKPVHVIAKEFHKSKGEIEGILKTCDWAIEKFVHIPRDEPKGRATVALNGFHDIGDGE